MGHIKKNVISCSKIIGLLHKYNSKRDTHLCNSRVTLSPTKLSIKLTVQVSQGPINFPSLPFRIMLIAHPSLDRGSNAFVQVQLPSCHHLEPVNQLSSWMVDPKYCFLFHFNKRLIIWKTSYYYHYEIGFQVKTKMGRNLYVFLSIHFRLVQTKYYTIDIILRNKSTLSLGLD